MNSEAFVLRIEKGKDKGREITCRSDRVRIGREAPCELVIEEDTVSRHHLTINFDGTDSLLTDENSANGTFLNGVRVRGVQKLTSGDVIGLGPDVRVRYEQGHPSSEGSAAARRPAKQTRNLLTQLDQVLRQNPLLTAAVTIAWVGTFVFLVYSSTASPGQGRLTKERAEYLTQSTTQFLAGASARKRVEGTPNVAQAAVLLAEGKRLEELSDKDPSAFYAAAIKYRQALLLCGYADLGTYMAASVESNTAGETPAQVAQALQQVLERLKTQLRDALFQGWRAEGHGQFREAVQSYERVLALVPDTGAPSYDFARRRLQALQR